MSSRVEGGTAGPWLRRRRRRRRLEALLLLLAALLFGRALTLPLELLAWENPPAADESGPWAGPRPPAWLLPLDDAYIFVRYAQQAARGRPFQWNDGEPSTGASSFVFTWLLLPPHWAGGDLATASRWSRGVGIATLWLLGLAAARLLRTAGLPDPWPLAGGLAAVWSGPVGFGAVAGMESAANAALILWAVALWIEAKRGWRTPAVEPKTGGPSPEGSDEADRAESPAAAPRTEPAGPVPGRARVLPLVAAGLLPLARPENAALALAAALAVAVGLGPWRRRMALLPLLPAAALALLGWWLTGEVQPAGALAKSWLGTPFLPLGTLLRQYPYELAGNLLPIYLGTAPGYRPVLWPPTGLLAAATALAALWAACAALLRRQRLVAANPDRLGKAASDRLAALAPLAVAWLLLVLFAPLSTLLLWQQMRHHHAGLACAWVLAVAGLAVAIDPLLGRRIRRAAVLLPLPLLAALPYWAREHTGAAIGLYDNHAAALAWLADHARDRVLLVNDAGLLSLAHDGPAIDVMGLGTPALTRAFRHGPGAIAETLARRRPLPEIAAVVPELFPLPELLGAPILPPPATPQGTLLAPVRRDLLQGTPLAGPGVDFGDLESERHAGVRWILPPGTRQPSFALPFTGPGGKPQIQGCRPVFGKVGVAAPPDLRSARVRVAMLPAGPGEVAVAAGNRRGPTSPPLAQTSLQPRSWAELEVPWSSAAYLWIERRGLGVPCVESVRFGGT